MIISDIFRRVRNTLLDTNLSRPRWTDGEISDYLDDAIEKIRSDRPDSRYDDDGGLFTDKYDSGGNPLMSDEFIEPVVYYIVHKCYLKDDSDSVNDGKATQFYQLYRTSIG